MTVEIEVPVDTTTNSGVIDTNNATQPTNDTEVTADPTEQSGMSISNDNSHVDEEEETAKHFEEGDTSFDVTFDTMNNSMNVNTEDTNMTDLGNISTSVFANQSIAQMITIPPGLPPNITPRIMQHPKLQNLDPNSFSENSTSQKSKFRISQEAAMARGFYENNLFLQDAIYDLKEDLQSGRYEVITRKEPIKESTEEDDSPFTIPKHEFTSWALDSQTMRSLRSNGGRVNLYQLVELGYLRFGDILKYNCTLDSSQLVHKIGIKKETILVKWDTTTKSLIFRIPTGQQTHISDHYGFAEISGLTTASMLEQQIMIHDGRVDISDIPTGNPYKRFTVFRMGEDHGSLWNLKLRVEENI